MALPKPWHIYLVRCNDQSLYCGISTDVEKRVQTHNSGKGAKYTKPRLPVTLVYQRLVGTKSEALSLEYKIKQMKKSEKEALIRSK